MSFFLYAVVLRDFLHKAGDDVIDAGNFDAFRAEVAEQTFIAAEVIGAQAVAELRGEIGIFAARAHRVIAVLERFARRMTQIFFHRTCQKRGPVMTVFFECRRAE